MSTPPHPYVRASLLVIALALASPAVAQTQTTQADSVAPPAPVAITVPGLPMPIFGPPPPIAPATSARDAAGRLTIRAVRLATPLRVDGKLDETVYAEVPAVSGFIQIDPKTGAPATQKTEFWVFFDDDNLYAVVRAHEANLEGMIANELRRDAFVITQNEYVNFAFDTFYDRRNAQIFVIAPTGGRMDGQLTSERQYNGDWNPVWRLRTGRFEGGWTAEAMIPFKSLRYQPGREQVWGLHVSRYNRWKNEISFPIAMDRARGASGAFQMSVAPTLVGIEAPPQARNLEIKPYAIAGVSSDLTAVPRVVNNGTAEIGVDAKLGITQGITADLTYNTDFAQVEADEQQLNLTRFNLFFPEKRDFFLENQGTFQFGGVVAAGGDAPVLFYSRRIGLNGSQVVPIYGGGRVSGRAGRYSLGIVDIQSKEDTASRVKSTNFSVVRVKRDILRRSSIGAIFTGRSVAQTGTGANQIYGADGVFAFYQNLLVNTYWARTVSDGRTGEDTSYRAQLDYTGDRYGLQVEQLGIGRNFNPEIGFVRRNDIRKSFGLVRFSPRTTRFTSVRKFFVSSSFQHLENSAGRKELESVEAEVAIEYQSSDRLAMNYSGTYEFIPAPFRIAPSVTVPIGGYNYDNVKLSFNVGQQRPFNGVAWFEYGTLYGGTKRAIGFSRGRIRLAMKMSLEPTMTLNHVELPQGTFNTNLIGSRATYTPTPLMFISALVQYNSTARALAANVRFRWEYTQGSELFVVYNDQRNTLGLGFPDLTNQAFLVKVNRLFRF
jgi:hypothetical protein